MSVCQKSSGDLGGISAIPWLYLAMLLVISRQYLRSHLGLGHHIDFVLTSRDLGDEKPSAEIFAEARRLAGVGRDERARDATSCGTSRSFVVAPRARAHV